MFVCCNPTEPKYFCWLEKFWINKIENFGNFFICDTACRSHTVATKISVCNYCINIYVVKNIRWKVSLQNKLHDQWISLSLMLLIFVMASHLWEKKSNISIFSIVVFKRKHTHKQLKNSKSIFFPNIILETMQCTQSSALKWSLLCCHVLKGSYVHESL